MQKKALTNGIIFLVLSVILFYCLDFVTGTILKRDDFDKVRWMAKIKQRKYDYAFLGDSRVYMMMKMGKLDSSWHKKGIDLALESSNIMEQYLILKKFIQNGNSIHDLFINVDYFIIIKPTNSIYRTWCFLPFIGEDDFVYEEMKRSFGSNQAWCWKYIPYYKYAEFNSKLGVFVALNSIFKFVKVSFDNNGDDYNGEFISHYKTNSLDSSVFKPVKVPKQYKVEAINLYYLEKIGILCEENHIRAHAYSAPYFSRNFETLSKGDSIFKRYIFPTVINAYADYHSFSNLPISKNPLCFADPLHANPKGIPYVNKAIADYYANLMLTR